MRRPHAVDVGAQPRTNASPSGARTMRNAASAAAVSAGVGAVVKMYGRDEVLDQFDIARRPGNEAAEGAERLRQGADPQDIDSVGYVDGRTEHRVGLVEDEQRALTRAQFAERVDRRDVAVHRDTRCR